jgi:hypothetical protein
MKLVNVVGSNPKGNDAALAGQDSVPNALGKDKFKLAKKPLKLKKGKYGVDSTPQAGITPGAVASGGCAGGGAPGA